MAVRRISDLPNLVTYYPNAVLGDSLIEVSYAYPTNPRRYQSFYAKLSEILSLMRDNLPRATHDEFGIVKIGDNISVVTSGSDKGLIDVPIGSKDKAGIVKIGDNINVDASGKISVSSPPDPPTATATSLGMVKTGDAATTNINITNGTISVPTATTTTKGVLNVTTGNGLQLVNGTLSMTASAPGIEVTPKVNTGTNIATVTVSGTSTEIWNGVPSDGSGCYMNYIDYWSDKALEIQIPGCPASNNANWWKYTSVAAFKMPFNGLLMYEQTEKKSLADTLVDSLTVGKSYDLTNGQITNVTKYPVNKGMIVKQQMQADSEHTDYYYVYGARVTSGNYASTAGTKRILRMFPMENSPLYGDINDYLSKYIRVMIWYYESATKKGWWKWDFASNSWDTNFRENFWS